MHCRCYSHCRNAGSTLCRRNYVGGRIRNILSDTTHTHWSGHRWRIRCHILVSSPHKHIQPVHWRRFGVTDNILWNMRCIPMHTVPQHTAAGKRCILHQTLCCMICTRFQSRWCPNSIQADRQCRSPFHWLQMCMLSSPQGPLQQPSNLCRRWRGNSIRRLGCMLCNGWNHTRHSWAHTHWDRACRCLSHLRRIQFGRRCMIAVCRRHSQWSKGTHHIHCKRQSLKNSLVCTLHKCPDHTQCNWRRSGIGMPGMTTGRSSSDWTGMSPWSNRALWIVARMPQ